MHEVGEVLDPFVLTMLTDWTGDATLTFATLSSDLICQVYSGFIFIGTPMCLLSQLAIATHTQAVGLLWESGFI